MKNDPHLPFSSPLCRCLRTGDADGSATLATLSEDEDEDETEDSQDDEVVPRELELATPA